MAGANNSYVLKLPADKMELFNGLKYQILNQSIELLLSNAASVQEISKTTENKSTSGKKPAGKR